MSVVLPAPFSPNSASTSPGSKARSTWSLATSPPNRLTTPRASRIGGLLADIGLPVGGGWGGPAYGAGDDDNGEDVRQQPDDLEGHVDALQLHRRRNRFGDAEQQRRAPGAERRPLAEDHGRQGDEPAPIGHQRLEVRHRLQREIAASQTGQRSSQDD